MKRWALGVAAFVPMLVGALCQCAGGDQRIGQIDLDASTSDADGGFVPSEACSPRCSDDLHAIVDCQDNVLTTCPADQGCGKTGCVAACDAARDNKSSFGCDFWPIAPTLPDPENGDCFAAFVSNAWSVPISITLERDGSPLDISAAARIPQGSGASLTYVPLPGGKLAPGQSAIVFLSQDPDAAGKCPNGITPAIVGNPSSEYGLGKSFHITTSAPAVAHQIMPFGGGDSTVASAMLLFPNSAWGDNYVAVTSFDPTMSEYTGFLSLTMLMIGAAEDGTVVTMLPRSQILGDMGPVEAGTPVQYMLNRGETMTVRPDHFGDVTGSPIQSNKPIQVMGGAMGMMLPCMGALCYGYADAEFQQIPPVKALGHEYIGARFRNRYATEETPPWRLVGSVDGTTLTWSGTVPPFAPTTIDAGQTLVVTGTGPFMVRSQDAEHPFYFAQYMTGCGHYATNASMDCRGDPAFVNVVATDQYLRAYTFFTDPTYPETNLVVVRKRGADGKLADVRLGCAGTLGGWTPIVDGYEFTRVDLSTGNFQGVAGCNNGQQTMSSTAPFAVTVWGWGSAASGGAHHCTQNCPPGFYSQAVSYAYPGGLGLKPINSVLVPPVPK